MLTKEKIEAMSDDEIDNFIAEKILRLHWVPVDDSNDWGTWEGDDVMDTKYVGWHDDHSWTPSCCIDDAMDVVKKFGLKQDDRTFVVCYSGHGTLWCAGWTDSLPPGFPSGFAHAPARAICNAIVAANEVKG